MRYSIRRRREGVNIFINVLLVAVIAAAALGSLAEMNTRSTVSADKTALPHSTAQPARAESGKPQEHQICVYDHSTGSNINMGLEEYVYHVVAAEMPASYGEEALKAQAVLARTLVCYRMDDPSSAHASAVVCTSYAHCQSYAGENALREKWGEDYDYYSDKVRRAVEDTSLMVAAYEGKPIQVFYHAAAGGMTEDVENVFSAYLPYLRSVYSGGERDGEEYRTQQTFTRAELTKLLKEAFPKAELDENRLEGQIVPTQHSQSGRVLGISVGGEEVPGTEFRHAIGLKSTNFKITFSEEKVQFTVLGYGHGVGMSQMGANRMAQQGSSWQEILSHYFSGVEYMRITGLQGA